MLSILWNPKKKTKPGVKWPHVWSESLQLSELHFLICKNGMPAALLPPQGCHKKQVMDDKVCNSTLDTKKCWILSRPCELLSSTFSLSKPKRSSLLHPLQPENLTSSIGSSLDSGLPIIIEQISSQFRARSNGTLISYLLLHTHREKVIDVHHDPKALQDSEVPSGKD